MKTVIELYKLSSYSNQIISKRQYE